MPDELTPQAPQLPEPPPPVLPQQQGPSQQPKVGMQPSSTPATAQTTRTNEGGRPPETPQTPGAPQVQQGQGLTAQAQTDVPQPGQPQPAQPQPQTPQPQQPSGAATPGQVNAGGLGGMAVSFEPSQVYTFDDIPSADKLQSYPPDAVVQTPYGNVSAADPNTGERTVRLNEQGKVLYQQRYKERKTRYGNYPTMGYPGAPVPTIRVTGRNFNPITGQWS